MAVMPVERRQWFDNNGNPLVNGKIYFYAAGTSTLLPTYTDRARLVQHENPVILDSSGRATIYLSPDVYKIRVDTALDVTLYTVDDISDTETEEEDLGDAIVSIEAYGAVSDGVTNDNAAVVAAIAAGHTRIFLPANTLWVPASDTIPGNVVYYGGNWESTIIKCANTATGFILLGPRASLHNVAIFDSIEPGVTVGVKSKRPVRVAHNLSNAAAQVQHYRYQSEYIVVGAAGIDDPAIAINLSGIGDGIFIGGNGDSACFHAWGNPSDPSTGAASGFLAEVFGLGPGLQINGEAGATCFALVRVRQKANVSGIVLDPTVNTGEGIVVTDAVKTSGQMIHLFQSTSAYTGTPLLIDMANGSGTHTGNFIKCTKNVVDQFVVDDDGRLVTKGQIAFPTPQNSSANANTLDDYQEQVPWTPVLTFDTPGNLNVVYDVQFGLITKLGNHVTATFHVNTTTFTHTTASGIMRLSGLPAPMPAYTLTGHSNHGSMVFQGLISAIFTQLAARVSSGLLTMSFVGSGFGQTPAEMTTVNTTTGTQIQLRGQVTYFSTT